MSLVNRNTNVSRLSVSIPQTLTFVVSFRFVLGPLNNLSKFQVEKFLNKYGV